MTDKQPQALAAAFVPGIMGSCLSADGGEIWGKDILSTFRMLADTPGLLDRSVPMRPTDVLDRANFAFFPTSFSGRLLEGLEQNARYTAKIRLHRLPYDWRQSNAESAKSIFHDLSTAVGFNVAKENGPIKFRLITHSMGALVVRLGIVQKLIHPSNVHDIVHIGAPLLGAPSAFGTLLTGDVISSPLYPIHNLLRLTYYKAKRGAKNLVASMATFPSVYELMPPKSSNYVLTFGPEDSTFEDLHNPVYREPLLLPLRPELARAARKVHDDLVRFEAEFAPLFDIRVVLCTRLRSEKTPFQYEISVDGLEYMLMYPIPLNAGIAGDGTVPAASARSARDTGRCTFIDVENCKHNNICDQNAVLAPLTTLGII